MRVSLQREIPGVWSVYVDDELVFSDGFSLASAVADALSNPDQWESTEAYEVAEQIRASRANHNTDGGNT